MNHITLHKIKKLLPILNKTSNTQYNIEQTKDKTYIIPNNNKDNKFEITNYKETYKDILTIIKK